MTVTDSRQLSAVEATYAMLSTLWSWKKQQQKKIGIGNIMDILKWGFITVEIYLLQSFSIKTFY